MSNPGNVSTEVLDSEIQGSLTAILSQCTDVHSQSDNAWKIS